MKWTVGDDRVVDIQLKVTLGGDEWMFDTDDLSVDQWISIEDAIAEVAEDTTRQSVPQWITAVTRSDARALKVLVWWLQGRRVKPASTDFKPGNLAFDVVEKALQENPKARRGKPATTGSPDSPPPTATPLRRSTA